MTTLDDLPISLGAARDLIRAEIAAALERLPGFARPQEPDPATDKQVCTDRWCAGFMKHTSGPECPLHTWPQQTSTSDQATRCHRCGSTTVPHMYDAVGGWPPYGYRCPVCSPLPQQTSAQKTGAPGANHGAAAGADDCGTVARSWPSDAEMWRQKSAFIDRELEQERAAHAVTLAELSRTAQLAADRGERLRAAESVLQEIAGYHGDSRWPQTAAQGYLDKKEGT